MKILGKNVSFHAHAAQSGDPLFIGLSIDKDECDGCGAPYYTTELGLGIVCLAMVIHNH